MYSFSRSALTLGALVGLCYGLASATSSAPTSLPLTFEANRGQAPPQYIYVLHHGLEARFFLRGADFILPERHGVETRLRLEFLSTNSHTRLAAEHLLKGQSNYLLGSDPTAFIRHVANYGEISYQDIYRGVALAFYGNGNNLEHDFTIAPQTDPSVIAFQLLGAKSVDLTPSGDLAVHIADGILILKKPVAYQADGDVRHPVAVDFRQKKDGSIGFRVGSYDVHRPLVIDPVFTFSTYLDGTNMDEVAAVTTDSAGNIYLTGTTSSTDFPTQSPEQSQLGCNPSGPGSCQNAFITKLDPTGKTLLYSTYLGGSVQDYGAAIAVDSKGDAIIVGVSSSSNFPNTGSVASISCQTNNYCYFVASLKPDGSALNYSGLIGGSQGYYTNGNNGRLAVDGSGNAYLAGVTGSSNFVITSGTLSTTVPGYPYTTMFVLKVDPTGKLLYSTVVPGNAPQDPSAVYNNWFLPTAIAVDGSGQVTVAGTAGPGLPTTAGVVAAAFPNNINAENPRAGFVLQLNASASAINYATYVPGTDTLGGMAVDASGNIYVAGGTGETNLPVSSNAYQKVPVEEENGSINTGYIAKLNGQGTAVLAASYLDGTTASLNNGTSFDGLALDSNTNVFVGGYTGSSDFPLQNPFTSEFVMGSTEWEMVLAEMSPDLSTLEFGSFLSSMDGTYPGSMFSALAIDPGNNLIVAGTTYASDFPTTTGSFETKPPPSGNPLVGYIHSYISKLNMGAAAPSICPAAWSVSFGPVPALTSSQKTLNITNCGNAALDFNTLTSSIATISATQTCGSVAPGATCPVTFTFSPIDDKVSSGTISIADNAAISPQVFQVSGQGQAPDLEPASNPFSLGHLLEGTQGPADTLFLFNRGNTQLTINSLAISGSGFSITQNNCSGSVSAGFFCTINLAFSPAASGTFNGSLKIDSNDPVHPQLVVGLTGAGDSAYSVPAISQVIGTYNQVLLQTMQINNGPVNLVLYGNNFYPQSIVQLNGVTQQATFTSNTSMQVTIAASSLTALGEIPLTVINPTPGGGASLPVTMTPFQILPLNPSALISVPSAGLLYAAMPSSDPTNPNTVIPINPATGTFGTPIPVGKNPVLLAASSNGAYLFVANATDLTVQRINLQTSTVDRTFPYSPNMSCTGCSTPSASDLQSIPGSPQEVVLAQGFQVSLYNDSGLVNCVPNSFVEYNAPHFDSIAFAGTPLTLYAEPFTSAQNPFFTTVAITSGGLQYTEFMGANFGPPSGTGNQVVSDGTLLYTNSGEVWNPATQTEVGSFPTSTVYEASGDLVLDTSLSQLFLTGLGDFSNSGEAYISLAISSFGQQSLAAEQTLTFPQINASENFDLVRWGSNGFGFVVPSLFSGAGIILTQSYALAGISPPNPVPVILSITPTEAAAGSATLTLTVNGTGFVSTSVVNWNGNALSTTFKSAVQLTAAVPASDIASPGTAQVTVTNPTPGGGMSSAQNFTFNLEAQTITFTNPGTQTVGTPLTLSATASSNLAVSFTSTTQTICMVSGTTATFIASGTCTIDANQAGNNTYAAAAMVAQSFTVNPEPIFTGGSGVGTISIEPGATTGNTVTITVTPTNGFTGTVNLNCSISPTAASDPATCSLSPNSVTISGTTAQTSTLTIYTSAASSAANQMKHLFWPATGGTTLAVILLFGIPRRRRNWLAMLGLLVLFASIGAMGCGGGGGGGGNTGTTPGTYSVTVTGTSGSLTVTLSTVTLIVQ
jgi:hypothetical protein